MAAAWALFNTQEKIVQVRCAAQGRSCSIVLPPCIHTQGLQQSKAVPEPAQPSPLFPSALGACGRAQGQELTHSRQHMPTVSWRASFLL